jgi:hypothetical protein
LREQRFALALWLGINQGPNLVEAEAQFAEHQHLLQPAQVVFVIQPVTGCAA